MRRITLLVVLGALAGCQTVKPDGPAAPLPGPASVRPVKVIGDIVGADGAAIDLHGNIYCANYIRRGTIGRLRPDGSASIFIDLAAVLPPKGDHTPAASGMKIDDDGNLIVADSGTGHVLRITPDGKKVEALVGDLEGEPLQSVNDIALDREDHIYFSAPPLMMAGLLKTWRSAAVVMNPEPLDCNGLAIAPTGQWFVIGDSAGRRVVMMDVIEGTGRNARTLIDFLPAGYPRDLSKTQQQELTTRNVAMPDGMVFDEFGRLYLATGEAGTVVVVEVPSGRVLATYALGVGEVRNLHFHNGDLYVTAGRGLYKLPLGVRGWRYSRGCGW